MGPLWEGRCFLKRRSASKFLYRLDKKNPMGSMVWPRSAGQGLIIVRALSFISKRV